MKLTINDYIILSALIWGFLFFPGVLKAEITKESPPKIPPISNENYNISLSGSPITLAEIFEYLSDTFEIKISGLKHRQTETVNISVSDVPIEKALQLLFKRIGETSYAFEYRGNKLCRVSVVPELSKDIHLSSENEESPQEMAESNELKPDEITSKELHPDIEINMPDSPIHRHFKKAATRIKNELEQDDPPRTAVEVLRVVEDTQAAEIELLKGDIVLEYNGVEINSAKKLVKEVEIGKELETASLLILRDEEYIDFDLKGGTIGISIQTVTLDQE